MPTHLYLSRCLSHSVSYVDIGHGQRCLKNDKWTGTTPYICTLVILHLNRAFGGSDSVDGSFSCRIHLFYFVRSFFLSIDFDFIHCYAQQVWLENLTRTHTKCRMNKNWCIEHECCFARAVRKNHQSTAKMEKKNCKNVCYEKHKRIIITDYCVYTLFSCAFYAFLNRIPLTNRK